jgi:DNA-binding CsgD family transcriptional regulator/tetratricopeptide (TPR) repeat protein
LDDDALTRMVTTLTGEPSTELLEREGELEALAALLDDVREHRRGWLVLVAGEAGVGKTTLLRRFCDEHRRSARILWGACDALYTPSPLGPMIEVAESSGGQLEALVHGDAKPYEVATALIHELGGYASSVLVLEDVHWADEATLDVIRLLGRKVEGVPALVLVSYRDELDRVHPLRVLTGELSAGPAVRRMRVDPLSSEAVARLAAPHGVDADDLYRKTGGNPFFVTEILAAADAEIPDTVRDAVLSRAARLSPEARDLLELVAVVPPRAEPWLLEALAPEALDRVEECVASGMLNSDPDALVFHHELARLAIEESLPSDQRVNLHRKALGALAAPPTGSPDLARLAHHAEAAGDAAAVLRFAPEAAAHAASLGAHREAAAQYARALRFGDRLELVERAEFLSHRSAECYLTDENDEAIEARLAALECYRELGDRRREGDSLRSLSEILWCPGRVAESERAGREAVAVLEELPPGRELAMAYSNLAGFLWDVDMSQRALELAEGMDDTEIVARTLAFLGFAESLRGVSGGVEKLTRALELASRAGLSEQVGNTFSLLGLAFLHTRSRASENQYLDEGIRYCSEHGLELFRLYLLAYRARSELDRGQWEDAATTAEAVVRVPRASTMPRTIAQVVLGLVRARRGDPGHAPPLDEAWSLSEQTDESLRFGPAAAARAEAAWLQGRNEAVAGVTEKALELATRERLPWMIGELASWRRRAGIEESLSDQAAEPYALQFAGEWARAAQLWTDLGCPYEAALSLADADEEEPLRRALDELQHLGARPAATIVARRLRVRGATGLPRGPRPTTEVNPVGLTAREMEVLALVAQGLRNAEIAERLVLAAKTVDHHVSAILRKLDVRTRGQASAEAIRLGLIGQDR